MMKRYARRLGRKRSILVAHAGVAFLLAAGAASAREVQKVGSASLTTLKISTSVRAIGMGDAYCATADDIQSIFWNPAGLIHVKRTSAAFTQVNMPAGVQFNTAAVARNLGRNGVVGLHLLAMNTGDMIVRTDEHPKGTGENFIAYDVVGGVSWAQRLTDRFIFGLNLRAVVSGLENETYIGTLADMGTLYETDLRTLKLGFSVQNFGPDVKYSGEYDDYLERGRRGPDSPLEKNSYTGAPPPTIYRIGLSSNLFEMTGLQPPPDVDGVMALEMSHPNDNRERINVGVELWYLQIIAVRAGYKIRLENVFGYDQQRATGGFGLRVPMGGERVALLDYAYLGFGELGEAADGFAETPHRFAIGINF